MFCKPSTQPVSQKIVLIVDDNEIYCRLLQRRLQSQDIPAITASSHENALKLLKDNPNINILLLDYNMHDSRPDPFIANLNSHDHKPRMIGHSAANRKSEFESLGVFEFIEKPLDVPGFLESLCATENTF